LLPGFRLTGEDPSGIMAPYGSSHSLARRYILCGTLRARGASITRQGTVTSDDHRLITEGLEGNPAALRSLGRRYPDRPYHTVYRMVDNQEDALDIVQEAFLNAYQSLDGFKGDSLFFTWLYRIAVNTAISFKRKRRIAVSIDAGPNGEAGIEPLDLSDLTRPGHALEQAEE